MTNIDLCKVIPIHLITSIHAFYKGYIIVSLGLLIEVILSLNYWRNPLLGLRRNIDIISTIFNCFLIIRINKIGVHFSIIPIYYMIMSYKYNYYNKKHLAKLYWKYFHIAVFCWCNLILFIS